MKSGMCVGILVALLITAGPVQAAFFQGLGHLTHEDDSYANAVSGDGRVVVGASGGRVFRWTRRSGMAEIFVGPEGGVGLGVSGDGRLVVGQEYEFFDGFRWTAAMGTEYFGFVPGIFENDPADVSDDGTVIVGSVGVYFFPPGLEKWAAYRWTEAGGTETLGYLLFDYPDVLPEMESSGSGVSADGQVVVGTSSLWLDNKPIRMQAFRWTRKGGMVGLGVLPEAHVSLGNAVSADGTVVVGRSMTLSDPSVWRWEKMEAFRWTRTEGMQGLGDLPGGDFSSVAHGVSGDGTIIVGTSKTDSGDEAFIWIQGYNKMYALKKMLAKSFGKAIEGWTLTSAVDISTDGMTIVGRGTNPDGEQEAWLAHLGRGIRFRFRPPALRLVTQ